MNFTNSQIDFPNKRKESTTLANPLFSGDIVNISESMLTMIDALCGLGSTDFAIISGLDWDGGTSTFLAPGLIFLNGKFLWVPTSLTSIAPGEQLTNDEQDGVPKLMGDLATTENIYHIYLAKKGTGAVPAYSPATAFNSAFIANSYRLNLTYLKNVILLMQNVIGGNTSNILALQAAMVEEAWHYIGTGAPVPAFENSWLNNGGAARTLRYKKDVNGYVHIEGTVKNGTLNQTVFTFDSVLQAAYIPTEEIKIPCTSYNGGTIYPIELAIIPNGAVTIIGLDNNMVSICGVYKPD